MNQSVLNSPLEMVTRVALILAARPGLPRSEDAIAKLDYLTTQAEDFGLSYSNLHGDAGFELAEFAARLKHIHAGIKMGVLARVITAQTTPSGLRYQITDKGNEYCDSLSSQYKNEYLYYLGTALAFVDSHQAVEITDFIEQKGVLIAREDEG